MQVFLTGASSGLGAALARRYAGEGATLGLVARREAELARLAASLAPATVANYACDVRDSDALARAGADFIARFGCPDVVIANAGISRGFLTELPEDLPAMRAIFETNVYGIVHTFQPFVAAMAQRRSVRVTIAASGLTVVAQVQTPEGEGAAGLMPLNLPASGTNTFAAPAGVSLTPADEVVIFDALGRPDAGKAFVVSGGAGTITVEAETGYVR